MFVYLTVTVTISRESNFMSANMELKSLMEGHLTSLHSVKILSA